MNGLMMKYFVLKPSGIDVYALASRAAIRTYATIIEPENPELANDIHKWLLELNTQWEKDITSNTSILTQKGSKHE